MSGVLTVDSSRVVPAFAAERFNPIVIRSLMHGYKS